jgi:hydroxymethylbilane synthase
LAIEIADGRADLQTLLDKINQPRDFQNVRHERDVLKSFGGGCHQKIGVARLDKPFGEWQIVYGLTDAGEILNRNELKTEGTLPKAAVRQNVFPLDPIDNRWFNRERINVRPVMSNAVWIARAEACPENFKPRGYLWTSGIQSWEKLAQKGLWVNGCAEGLGNEDPRIEAMTGPLDWVKLTHEAAARPGDTATYRLVPKPDAPDLNGKTHFFWMSSTSFRKALELYPTEVESGFHGCGPGRTYEFLREQPLNNPPKIFLGLDAFLDAVLPS